MLCDVNVLHRHQQKPRAWCPVAAPARLAPLAPTQSINLAPNLLNAAATTILRIPAVVGVMQVQQVVQSARAVPFVAARPAQARRSQCRRQQQQEKPQAQRRGARLRAQTKESKTEDAPADKRAGRATYRPTTYTELVDDAVTAVAAAVKDGLNRLEVEFPAVSNVDGGCRLRRRRRCRPGPSCCAPGTCVRCKGAWVHRCKYSLARCRHLYGLGSRGAPPPRRPPPPAPDSVAPAATAAPCPRLPACLPAGYKGASDLYIDANIQLAIAAGRKVRCTQCLAGLPTTTLLLLGPAALGWPAWAWPSGGEALGRHSPCF